MKLHRLTLTNFKGARDVVFSPNGFDADVYGDNATGKTTLADAWFWLLFGKDSANRADFEIKTLGPEGVVHGLDHTVEAGLELEGGERLTLKKTYREQWVKERGQAAKTFSGHTTDHWINGVPVQKKEYDARVASICPETTFRLLTDPTCFNVALPWQKRRELLLQVCGDLTDADVVASKRELADLPAILGAHRLDDYRKVLAARKREINEELGKLPVRIDEARRSARPDGKPEPIEPLREKARDLRERQARLAAGGEIAERQVRLKEIEGDLSEIRRRVDARNASRAKEARESAQDAERKIADAKVALRCLEDSRLALDREADAVQKRVDDMRKRFKSESEKGFAGQETCPACGQALPAERVQAAVEEFNAEKARRLSEIQADGKALRARLDGLNESVKDAHRAVEEAQARVQELERARAEPPAVEVETPETYPEWPGLLEEKARLETEIAALREGSRAAETALDAEIREVETRIAGSERIVAALAQAKAAGVRVAELADRERELAGQAERVERELFLTEEFVRTKVNLLTDRINSRFEIARFKLFEEQVNGAIAECCEVTLEGVPYGSLNHGARLNVGLDVIRTLSEHMAFSPPVWVDNAESVTAILPTKGQQIRLVVSANDKQLRFETRAATAQGALL